MKADFVVHTWRLERTHIDASFLFVLVSSELRWKLIWYKKGYGAYNAVSDKAERYIKLVQPVLKLIMSLLMIGRLVLRVIILLKQT